MRKKMSKKLMAVALSAGMALSLAACTTEQPADPVDPVDPVNPVDPEPTGDSNILIDPATGEAYDLGGMEIIIRDWWSSGEVAEATSDYEEARNEWREWIQETYNFKIKEMAISDWGSAPDDFISYASQPADDQNYVFVLRSCASTCSAMSSGLMYDLSTLDCLDFSDAKFQRNKLHEQFSQGSAIYAMYAGYSEPRTGVYFNKQVLKDAGVEADDIYDMQANGTWTWDAFDEIMGKVQRDTNNDGIDDVYGLTLNEGVMTGAAMYSNGGEIIGKDANGYTYRVEDDCTMEALQWAIDMYSKYDKHDPEGVAWDYYKEEFLGGNVAFMVDDEYCGVGDNFLKDVEFEVGFVMFPKGPQAQTYVNCWSNNPACIPANYDADRAWKIAFAWNLYTTQPEGYEDYIDLSQPRAGVFDSRAVDETIVMMMQPEHGMVTYDGFIPNLDTGEPFLWKVGPDADLASIVEGFSTSYQTLVDAANGK